jgi:FAD synthase
MKIHSLRGNVVREQEITLQEGLTTIQVNVSGLASGVYFVNIIAGNAVLRGTIIKQ